ncbi:hypothetical protein PUNSTDRAFT_84757 [Punctularia strigosozonata HHB-11173 SS5]|uniref:uncharacterized protein n=1 Tax=Punctularia strigosozonata (strain HHB-11173) TaxID=741275 RepID=UPI0004418550|nr:uncharacterized protein PUNSTDRAFT_84757 [Punctularia strigosozonata HHB-11173 SS5]EIN10587.1 hypothetical protein PUNSTDRAFT_84757 [Punctularia strigosozonata HHB-11173 SS5]
MSIVQLRVELPAHSYSFTIDVSSNATILDVKREISRSCAGAPLIEGQRLIYRGRFVADAEKVEDLWKSSDESRVLHLAVHPSAWTTKPPTISSPAAPDIASALQQAAEMPSLSSQQSYPSTPAYQPGSFATLGHNPLTYVIFRHNNALLALMQEPLVPMTGSAEERQLRTMAVEAVQKYGFVWPSILDEEFPAPSNETNGLKYERTTIQNGLYLTLVTPDAQPTPLQSHALSVLTHTFPLLSLSLPNVRSQTSITAPPDVNVQDLNRHLRQMGIPPLRVAVADLPVRALMAPMLILAFRTAFLLYFFSPTKKPVFAFMIGAWVLYEAWCAIRGVLGGEVDRDDEGRARPVPRAAANAPPGVAQDPAVAAARPGQNGARTAARPSQSDIILQNIADVNMAMEERALSASADSRPVREPSLGQKVSMFFFLLLTTLHPAIWDQRRKLLRRREGRIRTEANAMEASEQRGVEGEDDRQAQARAEAREQLLAQHRRRPQWVRDYIQRVRSGDWVDD